MSHINRPGCELAFSFQAHTCGDRKCGLHIVPERRDGTPICEMVIGKDGVSGLLMLIHENGLDLPTEE